ELYEDNIGLRAIATVTDEQVIEKARNKELRGWSFGFVSEKDSWEEGEAGVQKRSIEELDGLGPLKMTDAEKAQQTITGTVKKLEKEGRIIVQRGEEDVLI
ncbi:HK97 family phage prohead protease, partial [Bacillus sp. SS-TM]